MVASTERYLVALPSAEQLGGHVARMGGSNENLAGLAGGGGADSPESNELFELLGHSELCTRLDKYFAVLNGLVYSKPAVRKFISSSHGASRLISSRLVSSRLVSSRLVSSRLVSSRLVSSRLVSSRLVSSRLSAHDMPSHPCTPSYV
jgi:hypothetical protein